MDFWRRWIEGRDECVYIVLVEDLNQVFNAIVGRSEAMYIW